MEVFRIEKRVFLPTMLAGIPGEKFSFRWNTKGHPIVYAAGTRSLALIEKMANIGIQYGGIPAAFAMTIIEIPDMLYRKLDPKAFPLNWNALDEYHPQTQSIGDAFLDSDEIALLVPSVIVKSEFNVLLNPGVMEKHEVAFRTEEIDARLQWP